MHPLSFGKGPLRAFPGLGRNAVEGFKPRRRWGISVHQVLRVSNLLLFWVETVLGCRQRTC